MQQSEEQCLGKDVYYLHFRTFLPHPLLFAALSPFHVTASSLAKDAIPFLREASSTRSCSMRVQYNAVCIRNW